MPNTGSFSLISILPVDPPFHKMHRTNTLKIIARSTPHFKKSIADLDAKIAPSSKPVGDWTHDQDVFVAARTRPLLPHESDQFNVMSEKRGQSCARVYECGVSVAGVPRVKVLDFKLDAYFEHSASTDAVFNDCLVPLVKLAKHNEVAAAFAYGQTGSGKTFTMSGLQNSLADELFKQAEHLSFHVGALQILGDVLTDLSANPGAVLSAREDMNGDVQISGLSEAQVFSPAEFRNFAEMAAQNRATSSTLKNGTSSRSHSILRVRIVNSVLSKAEDGILYLIDLAGSERNTDSAEHDMARLAETKAINTSLMVLKDCLRSRSRASIDASQRVHVPWRTSKLTLVLKPIFCLESRRICKTLVIANVAPGVADMAHSISTLRYVVPVRIGLAKQHLKKFLSDDPRSWDHERIRQWASSYRSKDGTVKIEPEWIAPNGEVGRELSLVPQAVLLERLMKAGNLSEPQAAMVAGDFWELIVSARVQEVKARSRRTTRTNVWEAEGSPG